MIQVDVDQTETPDIIFGLIECEEQVIGDLCCHLAVQQMDFSERVLRRRTVA